MKLIIVILRVKTFFDVLAGKKCNVSEDLWQVITGWKGLKVPPFLWATDLIDRHSMVQDSVNFH